MTNHVSQSYLKHYGVKGMRWGVRHERERTGRRTRKRADSSVDKRNSKKYNSGHGLTTGQKRAIRTGAALVLAAVTIYGAKKMGYLDTENLYTAKKYVGKALGKVGDIPIKQATPPNTPKPQSSQTSSQKSPDQQNPQKVQKNQQTQRSKTTPIIRDPKTGFKMIHETVEDSLKNTNPLRGTDEGTTNCTRCAVAGFLRMKGIDAKAKGTGGKEQNLVRVLESCFSGVDVKTGYATTFSKSPEDAARMLKKKFGDNASGAVSVEWKRGPVEAHAFNWMIKEGKVRFLDFQEGYDDEFIRSVYWPMIKSDGRLSFAQLDADGVSLNLDNIDNYVSGR